MELRIQSFRPAFDLLAIALAQRGLQSTHGGGDVVARAFIENVGLVAEVLLRMPEQELAMLDVSRSEHAAENYSINPICKSQSTFIFAPSFPVVTEARRLRARESRRQTPARPQATRYLIARRSTTKTMVALGGILPSGVPASP